MKPRVAAGPFIINDLFPGAQSGDLQVTVTESDGSTRVFTQPYSAVPFMRRRGSLKYSLNAGRFHSGSGDARSPEFVEGAFFYGLLSEDDGVWRLSYGEQLPVPVQLA